MVKQWAHNVESIGSDIPDWTANGSYLLALKSNTCTCKKIHKWIHEFVTIMYVIYSLDFTIEKLLSA